MSVSGISSSSFFNTQPTNVQNQQQWQQELQKLTQEMQDGSLASPVATAQTATQTPIAALQTGSPSSAIPTAQNSEPGSQLLNAPHGTPKHSLHWRHPHRLQVGAGNSNDQESNPSAQTLGPGNSSTARQAYTSWQQDLQRVALNSDLLSAQNANWQPVSLSA
jgi:hypothetical protein